MDDPGTVAPRVSRQRASSSVGLLLLMPLALLVLLVIVLRASWIGYLGSDDVTYARGARGWLVEFPYLGGHGTIRHTVTIPIALSFLLLGENIRALVLPTVLYFCVIVFGTYLFLQRAVNALTGVIAGAILIITPLFAVQSTIASADIAELAFVAASIGCFFVATHSSRSQAALFGAGISAGLAWLTRETAAALVLYYVVLFLTGYGVRRSRYWIVAAGFGIVAALELTYITAITGDPFYRLNIARNHAAHYVFSTDVGNLQAHPSLDPLLMLVANQEFGILFLASIPAVLWAYASQGVPGSARRLARLLSGLGITWLLFTWASYGFSVLPLLPRYEMPAAYAAVVVVALFCGDTWRRGQRLVAALFVAALAATNLLALHLENKDYMFGEFALLRFLETTDAPVVYTDPVTAHRAAWLLASEGYGSRVRSAIAPEGSLFLENPTRTAVPSRLLPASVRQAYVPDSKWPVVWSDEPPSKLIGRMLRKTRLDHLLPDRVVAKLNQPHPGVRVFRVGSRHGDDSSV